MQDQMHFDTLESIVRFLEKRLLDPNSGLGGYKYYYLLQGNMTLLNKGEQNKIYFSGTNHIDQQNSLILIDYLLSTVNKNDLVLIEVGHGTTGFCENDVLTDLKREASKLNHSIEGLKLEEFDKPSFGEMTYATNLASSKGAIIRNIDVQSNPEAFKFIIDHYGIEILIQELKLGYDSYLETEEGLNRYLMDLFSRNEIKVNSTIIQQTRRRRITEEDSLPSDKDREDYMSSEVLRQLRNPLYVITHTAHMTGILKRIGKVRKVLNFSATVIPNSIMYNWERPTKNDFAFRSNVKRDMVIYKAINWLLYHVT